jgi:hypothetical protein
MIFGSPYLDQMTEKHSLQPPRVLRRCQIRLTRGMKRFDQFTVHIELKLIGGLISDTNAAAATLAG